LYQIPPSPVGSPDRALNSKVGNVPFENKTVSFFLLFPIPALDIESVQIVCSRCFSYCNALSLISFKTDSKSIDRAPKVRYPRFPRSLEKVVDCLQSL
jgi:hypothetical protein